MSTVEEAQAPDVFDVLAFVEGTAYPTEEVVLFQDVKSADEYIKLVKERDAFELENAKKKGSRAVEITSLTARIEELGDKISASSIIVELRGMPPGVVNSIMEVPKGEDEELHSKDRDDELIARSILTVRNAKGVYDTRTWTGYDVTKLRDFLKEGEFGKLITATGSVNFNALVFTNATDAGFSGRSTDVPA